MSETKTCTLNKIQQLIDLNGDTVNFDLSFTASTSDGSTFSALVVDQTTLDSNPKLDFKVAKGEISGNIISDKGVYQNYFLVLKSDHPCECQIVIKKKEIPAAPIPVQSAPVQQSSIAVPKSNTKSNINWRMILLVVVVIAGIGLLYSFYNKKADITSSSEPKVNISSPQVVEKAPTVTTFGFGRNETLIERLNRLNMDTRLKE